MFYMFVLFSDIMQLFNDSSLSQEDQEDNFLGLWNAFRSIKGFSTFRFARGELTKRLHI